MKINIFSYCIFLIIGEVMVKRAFTLSEVMLVLSVIGVIAALTLPGVIQNLNNKQYKTMWRKDFSIVSQAMMQVLNEYGYPDYKPFIGTYSPTAVRTLYPELKKYLSISKDCNYNNCLSLNYKDASGRVMSNSLFDDGQAILADGAFLAVQNEVFGAEGTYIFVDVNGYFKGPNVAGKDLFGLQVLPGKIVAIGGIGTTLENVDCSAINTTFSVYSSPADGLTCSVNYLQN